jgi:hypothetical protein
LGPVNGIPTPSISRGTIGMASVPERRHNKAEMAEDYLQIIRDYIAHIKEKSLTEKQIPTEAVDVFDRLIEETDIPDHSNVQ